MIPTQGTLVGTGPNTIGTTAGNAKELGMNSMAENASMNVVSPTGTLLGGGPNTMADSNGGMSNEIDQSNDTTMMPVPSGTIVMDNRWGI